MRPRVTKATRPDPNSALGGQVHQPDQPKGIAALVAQLVDDAKAYARAEMTFLRALAEARSREAMIAGALFAAAITLANAVAIALIVGLMALLSEAIGLFWALVAIVLGGTLIVGGLGWWGWIYARRVGAPLDLEEEG